MTKPSSHSGAFAGLSVVIDALNVSLARGTGVATYARGLAETLLEGGAGLDFLFDRPLKDDPAAAETAAFDAQIEAAPRALGRIGVAARLLRDQGLRAQRAAPGVVNRQAYAGRIPADAGVALAPDLARIAEAFFRRTGSLLPVHLSPAARIAHWTTPFPARLQGAINIVTIHDLVPLTLPASTLDPKAQFSALVRRLATTADRLITVSDASRTEIIRLLGAPAERVTVIPPRVEPDPVVENESEAELRASLRDVYGLNFKGYFLFFGSIEPKKNIDALIEAYAGAGVEAPLVVVSALAWLSERDFARLSPYADAARGPLSDKVRRLDYLPPRDLQRLMRGARAVMLASAAEGFGLPIAEAAVYGTPAIASKHGATAETTGPGGLLVDPFDPRDIRNAIIALDGDPRRAADLGALAAAHARRFAKAPHFKALKDLYQSLGALPVAR